LGDRAVRPRTTPISSAIAARRLDAISSATGSRSRIAVLQHEATEAIDGEMPPRGHQGGGAVLADHRRTAKRRPGTQLVATVNRRPLCAAVEEDGPHRMGPGDAASRQGLARKPEAVSSRTHAKRHHLERMIGSRMPEQTPVAGVELALPAARV